ncbi:hypothetical protein [Robertmurraya korlensis]|uniref:hypothetical protein n=1 Tax=Robertmurraya korlensis TaxID=519977 RepID=UPI000A4C3040|nr:hypothetical protein [Robertmurraya korlensis]
MSKVNKKEIRKGIDLYISPSEVFTMEDKLKIMNAIQNTEKIEKKSLLPKILSAAGITSLAFIIMYIIIGEPQIDTSRELGEQVLVDTDKQPFTDTSVNSNQAVEKENPDSTSIISDDFDITPEEEIIQNTPIIQDKTKDVTEKAPEEVKQEAPVTQVEKEEVTLNFLKENLSIGMTTEQVYSLLGTPSVGDQTELWRYDIGTATDYSFISQGEDHIDSEGLINGKLKLQLFIRWDSNKTHTISVAYHDPADHYIDVFHRFQDGTEKTDSK